MAAPPQGLTLNQLMRSSLVVAGLLLIAIGVPESLTGRSKIAEYQEALREATPPAPADPAALFPKATEGQERYELARAKLGFYRLILHTGQGLSALGFTLLAIGVLRLRRVRAPRAPTATPVAN